MVTYLTSGLPFFITQIFVDVPPTYMKIPLSILKCSRAPATLAAGPDKTVKIGLVLKVLISVRPPSPFIIVSGAEISC